MLYTYSKKGYSFAALTSELIHQVSSKTKVLCCTSLTQMRPNSM